MLDEPFTMLEPIYIDLIKQLLLKLKETKGILLTDHYYTDVLEISDANILLKDGIKHEVSNKSDLINKGYILA